MLLKNEDRGHPGRRLHARARRLRARRDDPRASALPEDRDHLHLGDPGQRHRSFARLRDGRGRLRAGAGRAGGAARQGQGVRRALPQDAAARTAECRARGPRVAHAPRNSRIPPRSCARARSGAAWRLPPARWARGTGTGSTATGCGTKASTASSASTRRASMSRSKTSRRCCIRMTSEQLRPGDRRSSTRAEAYEAEFRVGRPERRGALVRRHGRRDGRPGGRVVRVSGVTVDITERKQRRGAAEPAGPRGGPSRQERAGAGAIDRAPHPRRQRQGLRQRRRRAHQRAGAGAHDPVAVELAGRRTSRLVDEELAPYRSAARSSWPVRKFSCRRRQRRRWRWRCMSSSPTRRNMARSRRGRGGSRSAGKSRTTCSTDLGRNRRPAGAGRRNPAASARGACLPA